MGIIEKLRHKTDFIDTSPLIYYLQENQKYIRFLHQIFSANDRGKFLFHTSVITLLEVLVLPMRQNSMELAENYQEILCNSPYLKMFDINTQIAIEAAKLRGGYEIKTPDSIQLATAIHCKSDFFLTNDIRLKVVKGIDFIILEENI